MASASDVKQGQYILVNKEPMRLMRKEVVSVGTHCHSKLKFYVQGLHSKAEKVLTLAHHEQVELLDIMRKTAQVIAKSNGKVQIMDTHSYETFEASVDEDYYNALTEGMEVTFVNFNGDVSVIDTRQNKG